METTNDKVQKTNSTEVTRQVSLHDLPESILLHILSFLPTKVVLRTSILSKRWRFLWTAIPNLEFYDSDDRNRRHSFLNIVNRVLLLHTFSHISKFSLTCNAEHDAPAINSWIIAVVRNNVTDLRIWLRDVNLDRPFLSPDCLWTCNSLRKLDFQLCRLIARPFRLPSVICFSNLKILILEKVVFLDDGPTNKLFSSCPLLEELCLRDFSWGMLKVVTISCPRLSKLTIVQDDEDSYDGCKVMITGTNLERFEGASYFFNEYIFSDVSLLTYSSIQLSGLDDDMNIPGLIKILRQMVNLQWLILDSDLHCGVMLEDVISRALEAGMPMFRNITKLELNQPMDYGKAKLAELFWKFPNLESLVIAEIDSEQHDMICSVERCRGKHWYNDVMTRSSPSPPCFLTHLRSIAIRVFNGGPLESWFVKILLRNARVLKELALTFQYRLTGQEMKNMAEIFLLSCKSLECCIVFMDRRGKCKGQFKMADIWSPLSEDEDEVEEMDCPNA